MSRFSRLACPLALGCLMALGAGGCGKESAPPAPEAPPSLGDPLPKPEPDPSVEPKRGSGPPPPTNAWEERFAAAATDDEKVSVLAEKAAEGPEHFAGLMRMALADPSERVATAALGRGTMLRDAEAVELYSTGVRHALPAVRHSAVEGVRELPRADRLGVYRNIVAESEGDVLGLAITDIAREATKPAFEILLGAYASPDPEVRASLNAEVLRLVGKEFQSLEEARAWWAGASSRFNEKLYEVTREP